MNKNKQKQIFFAFIILLILGVSLKGFQNDILFAVSWPVRQMSVIKQYLTTQSKSLQTIAQLKDENAQLRLELDQKTFPNVHEARIFYHTTGNLSSSFVIEKITNKTHVPIKGKNGFIGQIIEQGLHTSRVRLIDDIHSKVPVFIEGYGKAMLCGKGGSIYLDKIIKDDQAKLPEVGAFVNTLGLCEIFPKNEHIAVVSDVKDDRIFIKPLEDFSKLSFVTVVEIN